ncbi:MAG: hypothetical protein ACR2KK_00125 [Acidimicrobiales bacterium]
MDTAQTKTQPQDNRPIVIWSAVSAIGVLMFAATYLPFVDLEQCPMHYTQSMVDSSNCIIGANIGAGLLAMAGIVIAVVGVLGLMVSLVARLVGTLRSAP